MKHRLNGFILVVLVILFSHSVGFAHKVSIFAWVEGHRVFTESKFSGGKMVKNGTVEVFDESGQKLLSGQTDNNGSFSFEIPKSVDLNIVLTAGMGHQSSWRLSAAELGADAAERTEKTNAPFSPEVLEAKMAPQSRADASTLTAREMEAIIARQLEQKIQPLTRMMVAAQDKGPTVADIFGGIGYVLGLVGLGAYVRYRRENRSS